MSNNESGWKAKLEDELADDERYLRYLNSRVGCEGPLDLESFLTIIDAKISNYRSKLTDAQTDLGEAISFGNDLVELMTSLVEDSEQPDPITSTALKKLAQGWLEHLKQDYEALSALPTWPD